MYTIESVKKAIGDTSKMNADQVKEAIMLKGKVPFSQVAKVYKALGYVTVRTSYVNAFYDLLRDKPMSDAQFETWVGKQSKNGRKHKSHFDAIRLLANDIHAG